MIFYFPEIPGTLSMTILMLIVAGLLLFGAFIVACITAKLIWVIIKEPCQEAYFDYLDWKTHRFHKRKNNLKWYEDYSKFK